jgi:protoporphyrinogen oxidase/glycosyltransferase involved in cell wall biosynthesis
MSRSAPIQSIIVFSHLRWNFVFQRPQHLLSRLARRYRIHFFEEPVPGETRQWLEIDAPAPNVRVYRPHSTIASPGFHDAQIPTLRQMVLDVVREERIDNYAVWFYSPMALPLMQELTPLAVVYDCMDELAAFHNAPRQLLQREGALLKRADLVFTGGPSLYRAKRDRHHNVHCFSSSVDAEHFCRAQQPGEDHPLQQALPKPRLGYFGVIDERLDLELLAKLADATAHWQICMVGPVVKIDPAKLPRRPNLHYFGQQAYDDLPRFIAGWDVCLQPFALNEATRFISPTKTLEYMAAGRPIVSTAITDVVEPYGHIVRIASDANSFIEECKRALQMSEEESAMRAQLMRNTVASTSWDQTVERMGALLEEVAGQQNPSSTQLTVFKESPPPPLLRAEPGDYSTIIIGAGPTGLSAAYHLGKGSLLLEQNATVGGWCRSLVEGGFTFDYAGHIMFSNDPYVHQMYQELLGDNVHWQDREAWIYSKNVYTRYPFQGALHGLPPDVLKECIVGAIEARFGRLEDKAANKSAASGSSASACKAESITDCCGDGVMESTARLGLPANSACLSAEPANFEEFIYKVWGAGVAKHFAIPYNRKLWAVPLTEMETSWLGGRVPLPNLEEMIEGALKPVPKQVGPNARFGYPLRGGFQALMNGFLPLLEGEARTRAQVSKVETRTRTVTLTDGSRYRYRKLVSTAPLPKLIEMLGAEVPENIRAAAQKLRHVSVRCVNLGVAREKITDKHWIYYPEDPVFHRIFVQGNASPRCNPPGGFGLTCEITYSPDKPLPCEGEDLIDRCIEDCIKVGLLRESDQILVRNQVDMPYAYVVYDHVRKHSVELIRQWLLKRDILLAGRYSEWEYYNSDHAFIAGKKIAEAVRGSLASSLPTKEPPARAAKGLTQDDSGVMEQASV